MATAAEALRPPSFADRIWHRVEERAPVPPQVVRATRIGLPKLPGALTNSEKARSLVTSARSLYREVRRKGETSVAERILQEEKTMNSLTTFLWAWGISARELVTIIAPDHAQAISPRKINWKEEARRFFKLKRGERVEDGPEVPEVLEHTVSPEFYGRVKRVVGEDLVHLGVTILGFLDEDALIGARGGINKVEDDLSEDWTEEHKDRYTKYFVEGAIRHYLKGVSISFLQQLEPQDSTSPRQEKKAG